MYLILYGAVLISHTGELGVSSNSSSLDHRQNYLRIPVLQRSASEPMDQGLTRAFSV